MAKEYLHKEEPQIREDWPRIRKIVVKGMDYYQVDGRPHFKRKAFASLGEAKVQADKWATTRERYGKAGRFISERDASRLAEAFDLLQPYGAGIVDAARHYAAHLAAEKRLHSGKLVSEALTEWRTSYEKKDRDEGTMRELASKAKIFGRAFGHLKFGELSRDMLIAWIEEYEAKPGKLATPHTRANLRTKLAQFLNFSQMKSWIEKNPISGFRLAQPPRTSVKILEIEETRRLIEAANRSENRATLLPYAAICLFAGLRPNSEAEELQWKDIHFSTGDIHVRAETSKTREERFVPMETNLIAWLETCPIRHPGPIIGTPRCKFRAAWEEVKRVAGYKVGIVPENGWPPLAQDWPADAMRHTYASMWLAVHKSRAELAERMGNSETTIKNHYRRAIREDVAKEFWALVPTPEFGTKIIRMKKSA